MKRVKLSYIVVIVSIVITCLSITLTVRSMTPDARYDEKYYDSIEEEYMEEMRAVLAEHAMYTSGITMTKITDADGNREYHVLIHDGKIDRMAEADRCILQEELEKISFAEENISFYHELTGKLNQ